MGIVVTLWYAVFCNRLDTNYILLKGFFFCYDMSWSLNDGRKWPWIRCLLEYVLFF